jgi:type IV fimbrial biogenesis protein FimT
MYGKYGEQEDLLAMKRRTMTHSGFTLIELMMTVVVATVLLMVAVPGFISFQRNSQLTSAANSLVAAINAARGEGMKRGMSAMVVPTSGNDWSTGWTAFVDTNGNKQLDAGTDFVVLEQPAVESYFAVTGKGTADASPPYILFDGSGYAKTKAAGFGALSVSIVRTDLSGAAKAEQTRHIIIAKTGRVRVCRPATSDTTCSADLEE